MQCVILFGKLWIVHAGASPLSGSTYAEYIYVTLGRITYEFAFYP